MVELELGRHEDVDKLVGKTAGRGHGGQIAHVVGDEPGLLVQLALGALERVLARIELAGGQLDRHAIERGAVLAHERDLARLGKRHDGGGPMMAHDVTTGRMAVRQLHLQRVDIEDLAGPRKLLGQDLLVQTGIALIVVAEHERRDVLLFGSVVGSLLGIQILLFHGCSLTYGHMRCLL